MSTKPRTKRKRDDAVTPYYDIKTFEDLLKLAKTSRYANNKDAQRLYEVYPELQKLSQMVGMKQLKNKILYQVLFFVQGLQNAEMMHTALMGPPGVGKTSVAEIIGKIYCKLGMLSKGHFKVVGREQLIGQYLGETAIKTANVLKNAIGGVLFIDEAYSLGNTGSGDSFSKECIDTINKFLSEHTRNFVCIIAGYPDQLESCFFARNAGLDRRFPWKYTLETYVPQELVEIFVTQLENSKWKLRTPDTLEEHIKTLITQDKSLFVNNGGDTQNFVNACKMAHAKRVFGAPRTWKRYLSKDDIDNGFTMYKESKKSGKTDSAPPPFMYL